MRAASEVVTRASKEFDFGMAFAGGAVGFHACQGPTPPMRSGLILVM